MRRPGWIIASVVMVLITFALLAFDPLTAPAPSPASGSTRGADVESGTGDGAPPTVPGIPSFGISMGAASAMIRSSYATGAISEPPQLTGTG